MILVPGSQDLQYDEYWSDKCWLWGVNFLSPTGVLYLNLSRNLQKWNANYGVNILAACLQLGIVSQQGVATVPVVAAAFPVVLGFA